MTRTLFGIATRNRPHFRTRLLAGAACALVLTAAASPAALAQRRADDAPALEEMKVFAERILRNRTDDINPVLSYDNEFFQRFEPESVGDMLKRVPGVAFSGDVGEYDGPQMRGLPAGFTQVLVNGERIAGSGADRSVFVDRIPAEIIERIEIVRSPSARLESQGIAGTVNIILKDSASFSGGAVSGGILYFPGDDRRNLGDKLRGKGSVLFADQIGRLSFLLNGSFTERRTPKNKETSVFALEDGQTVDGFATVGELDEFETERDLRDSDDYAFNWDFGLDTGRDGTVSLDGFFILTERTEREDVTVFAAGDSTGADTSLFRDTSINVDPADFPFLEIDDQEFQFEDIEQTQWELDLDIEQPLNDRLTLVAGGSFNRFNDDIVNIEGPVDDGEDITEERETLDSTTDEWQVDAGLVWTPHMAHSIEVGGDLRLRSRDTENIIIEIDDGEESDETPGSGIFEIDEDVFAGYVVHTWDAGGGLTLEHGLRVEHTDLTGTGTGGTADADYTDVNPSLAYRWDVTPNDRLRLSASRTLRRPDFDQLVPFENEDQPDDDQSVFGNPELDPETAWGIDVGYERSFQNGRGIAGINFFYRDINDLIELSEFADDQFTFRNVGDGEVYGVELDASFTLAEIGLPDTSLFGNFAYLESEVTDEITGLDREFNLQPQFVSNVGFNHTFPEIGFTFGASYQRQGRLFEFEADEVTRQSRNGFLEAFIEQRVMENILVRLTASNLTDQTKVERKVGFDGIGDRAAGIAEQTEMELEETGPWFRFIVRAAF